MDDFFNGVTTRHSYLFNMRILKYFYVFFPFVQPIRIQSPKYEWVSPSHEKGDCSLWVRKANLQFDDGTWECKVEPSDYTTDDALTSNPVQLVVRGKF